MPNKFCEFCGRPLLKTKCSTFDPTTGKKISSIWECPKWFGFWNNLLLLGIGHTARSFNEERKKAKNS